MGANIKAIRARIKSVESTRHITKAMELVASSKLKKAEERTDESRFYKKVMLDAFEELSVSGGVYSKSRDRNLPALYIIAAGDRGLAGGSNNNIFRSSEIVMKDNDMVLPIGKRSVEYYKNHGRKCVSEEFTSLENFDGSDCKKAAESVRNLYDSGEICSVSLIYTKFNSMMSQTPDIVYLLPLGKKNSKKRAGEAKHDALHTDETERAENAKRSAATLYEPSTEEVLSAVIPEYIAGVLYSSVCEAYMSELAARRMAMDTATKNAEEMTETLNLHYNRARQGAITQEITEIVAGAGL